MVLGVALLSVVALVASLAIHAETGVGKQAAEHVIEWTGSETSRGTLRIGRVRSLPPGRLSLLDYRMIAPNGEVVIAADEIAGMPEASGLLDGEIRFRPSWFVRARIRLTPGPGGQVNLVHASEVPNDTPTIPLLFKDIRLIDNTLYVALPGKPALTMRHIYGMADLRIDHLWEWRLSDNRGEIDLPIVEPNFRQMNGRLRSDHAHPLVVRMIVDAAIVEPTLALDYYVPRMAGREGDPYFDLDLGESIAGSGVDETEEQEEARDALAEAREELEEAVRAARATEDPAERRELHAEIDRRRDVVRDAEEHRREVR